MTPVCKIGARRLRCAGNPPAAAPAFPPPDAPDAPDAPGGADAREGEVFVISSVSATVQQARRGLGAAIHDFRRRTLAPPDHSWGEVSMPEISAALILALRDKTSAGVMACKRALREAQGDLALDAAPRRRRRRRADRDIRLRAPQLRR